MLVNNLKRRKAAQYLRMSTDHQQYSFYNQSEFNQRYAKQHQIEIICTYQDAGKSGVTLIGRKGFQTMLDDVRQKRINIDVILVYDVSRFGRFQDPDESAFYHYLFKKHGVNVIYCAEPMSEEHPEISMMALNHQRFGAAYLSKNLSEKVFAGQANLIKRGYRQGGMAGYGLRRLLVDEHDNPKEMLAYGKRKSIQTDRVKLVPGPEEEIDWVNKIFDMFIVEGKPERVIASELNRENIPAENGSLWTRGKVHQILTNEKYVGNNVFNKTSFKLKRKFVKNAPEEWIRYDNAYTSIVPVQKFTEAQNIILTRSVRLTDNQLLDSLIQLLRKRGQLTGFIIDEEDFLPSSSVYRHRFGGLLKAYALIGYSPPQNYQYIEVNRFLRGYHQNVLDTLVAGIREVNGWIELKSDPSLLRINDEIDLSVVISRCQRLASGKRRWKIQFDRSFAPDITIAVRMDATNKHPLDYYIFPSIDIVHNELKMAEINSLYLEFYRFSSLAPFFNLVKRCTLMESL